MIVHIRHGAVPSYATTNPMELQKVIIHLARRRQFSIATVYLSPRRSGYCNNHQCGQSWLNHLPKDPGHVCVDFNAHHSSMDDYVSTDPANVGSYRPIALTSTMWKVLERLIANRLSWWLEEHSSLSPWLAGFRNGRSTDDQCLWQSYFISNGFQSTHRRRVGAWA